MPLKPIKHANKGNIVFLNNGSYDQLFSHILQVLGKDAPFIPLTIQGPNLSWIPVKSGKYMSLAQAPDDILGSLGLLWEQMKNDLLPLLAAQKLDYVLQVPDLSYVFYVEDPTCNDGVLNHKFKLYITGWACQLGHNANNEGDESLRNRMFEAQNKHQHVIVKMQSEDNRPMANADFLYSFSSITQDVHTDVAGCYVVGVCVVGSKLSFTSKQTGQTREVIVQKNIEVYPITFAPTTTIQAKIVDQYNNPIQSYPVSIEYGAKTFNVDTDGLGELRIPDVLYLDSSLQMTIDAGELGKETFDVTCPLCRVIMHVKVAEKVHLFLKIVRGEEETVAGYSVRFSGDMVGTYASNENGLISLERLKWGDSFSVESVTEKDIAVRKFVIVEGQSEYIFNLPKEPKEEIVPSQPEIKKCNVKVVRGEEYKPVPDYSLRFESESMTGVRLTDANGIVPLENMIVGMSVKVFVANNGEPIQFQIENEKEEYLIQLPEEPKPVQPQYYIKVVKGANLVPVPSYPLYLEGDGIAGERLTDENGIVLLGDMNAGVSFKVHISEKTETYTFQINENQEEYLIRLDEEIEPELHCYIKVVRGREQNPVESYSLRIESETMQGFFLTDELGVLPLENMKLGMQVVCYASQDNPPTVFKIEKGKEEYLIQLEDETGGLLRGDIKVTLLDKDRTTPITPATITLTNKGGGRFVQRNDDTGSIIVTRSFFNNKEKVRFHAENDKQKIKDCKFRYEEECDHYIIYLVDPFPWRRLLWLLLLPLLLLFSFIGCERDIVAHTIDVKGNDVGGAMVQLKYTEHAIFKNHKLFYNKSQNFQGVTDVNGYYTFKDVPCSVYSYIFYCFQKAVVNGGRNANFGGSSKFLFHWRKNIDVVIRNNKQVQVISRKTNQPVAGAQVDVNFETRNQVDTTMITDAMGMCELWNLENPSTTLAQLTVTKTGYSGTRLMDVEVDELSSSPLIVYLETPEPCKDQGDSNTDRRHGNVAMRDYDMGVEGGTFLFYYYTDSAPDDIAVYDGSSSDYVKGTAKQLFEFSGATNTTTLQHYEMLTFSSRYICVVAKGGTNWGYLVQCPEIN